MKAATTEPEISVIIPLFREAENLRPLHSETSAALNAIGQDYELIFVDDGSNDGTIEELRRLIDKDRSVKALRFSKNFGQTAAIQAGIDHSRGEILVTMDGDLQNDPRDIGLLIDELSKGYDLVVGWRKFRHDKLLSRKVLSWVANWIMGILTGVKIHDNGCGLKACKRQVLMLNPLYADMHRYLTVVVALAGGTYKEIVVRHRPRLHGDSKYGLSRIWKVLLDLISLTMMARFVSRPAKWFGVLSLVPFCLAVVAAIGSIHQYLTVGSGEQFPIVFTGSVVLFTFAVLHLLLMGAVGELIVWLGHLSNRTRETPLLGGDS